MEGTELERRIYVLEARKGVLMNCDLQIGHVPEA
jgi:hypothetical protein